MGVSENGGTPKSSNLIGISIINHPFWGTPVFLETPIFSHKHLSGSWSKVFIAPPNNLALNLGSLNNLSQSRRWKWFGWKISLEDYINHPKKGGGLCRKMVFWKPTEFPHVQTSASAGLSGNRTLHLLNVWRFACKNQVISWRTKTNSLWHFFEAFLITFSCCRSMIFVKKLQGWSRYIWFDWLGFLAGWCEPPRVVAKPLLKPFGRKNGLQLLTTAHH